MPMTVVRLLLGSYVYCDATLTASHQLVRTAEAIPQGKRIAIRPPCSIIPAPRRAGAGV